MYTNIGLYILYIHICIYIYIAIYIYSQVTFFTQKPLKGQLSHHDRCDPLHLATKGKPSGARADLRTKLRNFYFETFNGTCLGRKTWGRNLGAKKMAWEKFGLGKIWLGTLDVYIHFFVGVIFHLLPQHLSFGKLLYRIQSVMSSKLSWWLEPIQVQACHIKWDPRHRKSNPTRLNFPCPS